MTTDNQTTIITAPINGMYTTSNITSALCFYFDNDNKEPMLEIKKDGFYVRGVRVNQDAQEAEVVYNAFHQWLMLNTLRS